MRRLPFILGLALIVAMTIREVYDFLVTNEGVRYFSSDPRRLLYVILLGVGGGLSTLWISGLSPGFRRRLKLAALGAFGVFLTGGLAFFCFVITTTAPMARETGRFWWMIAGLLGMCFAVGLVWWEFYHEWRRS